jgi:hypothetical protein
MTSITRSFTLASVAALVAAPAVAQTGRSWINFCGGTTFATCASVDVRITGQNVTLRLWNMSGFNGTYVNTVLNAVGFTNVGTAQAVEGSLTMSGPARAGDSPGAWVLRNNINTVQPGIFLDLVSGAGGLDNGIIDACATSVVDSLNFWENPCQAPTGPTDPGWVVVNFDITGTWDLSQTWVTIHGQDPVGGGQTDCYTGGPLVNCTTSIPEPMTIALLGTGLAGVGGFGFIRSRRRRNHDVGS